ncbi:3-dehydroquinate synthase [Buchnera aphidicola (Cinara kochiana kochiana)]|uniref:3-dehydroquinate synthase n=1 Tax=Buchnera aphidicola (Cinara kochiana kochiana) TaxID=2518976 RepID=A0A451D5X6_9GAMM|nr:3-dehydroquinate synthase [Buchnera aphidicola]VFP81259.1 3-dehydroquinate synthase [Buchnera aphidicola (Cinara kochiana kochiana)]
MVYKISVSLDHSSYDIHIYNKFSSNLSIPTIILNNKNSVIITNDTVRSIIAKKKYTYINKIIKNIPFFTIKDGESYKNLQVVESIIHFLLEKSYGRDVTLIALGGGVIGDITGFVASIYQRGVNFFQIPTTLLAQVDASIGGKTGVNHKLGKNMIGSFWQPNGVFIDINFLFTLPREHIISGMAEIIKYAIIFDKKFFIWLEENLLKILSLQEKELLFCIKKCCELKARVIQNDEKENNIRIFLNLGHSFAHAIETYTGYGKWLHGYAVSVGIIMASYLSVQLNLLHECNFFRIVKILYNIGLPIKGPKKMLPDDYILLMLRDKKVLNKIMRLVVPVDIGKVKLVSSVKESVLLNSIRNCQEQIYKF